MRGVHNHDEHTKKIADEVKQSAYEIITRKKATYYGIAMAVKRICEAIVRDEKSVLPVSNLMHGAYGIEDITLSMPAVVGKNGVELQMPISLDGNEALALKSSADMLKKIAKDAGVGN
jgi:L-lactate dehydrogenase